MKKRTLTALFFMFILTMVSFAADLQTSELDIYNELNICANAKYYPGIIEQSELLEKNYPQSVFIVAARIAKGQALIGLNRYEEAEENFLKVLSSLHFGAEEFAQCWYYLALAYYYDGDYSNALPAFHTVCDAELRENRKEYYYLSILYAGRINFFMELYQDSLPLLEYVVGNGNYYSKRDYDEALQKLFFAYNSLNLYENTINLYKKLSAQDFSVDVYSALTIYTADAYEKKGQTEQAYITLQNNQNEDFKEMLSAFRLNLGAAAYSKKDYQKAGEYLSLAKESSNPKIIYSAFIYEEKIKLDLQGKAIAGELEAELLSEEAAIMETAAGLKGLADSYYSLLFRCKAFTDDSSAALSYYHKIEKPGAREAYIAAFLLQDSAPLEAQLLLAPFTANSDCAKLNAALLAKKGNYTEACSQYALLEKNNKLDALTLLEYAKVLYHLQKWQDALSICLKSKAPLSTYLAGLCQYNLGDYKNAYKSLSSCKAGEYKMLCEFYKGTCAYKLADYKKAYELLSVFPNAYKQSGSYLYKACELAAKSALMTGSFKQAALMAEEMIKAAENKSQKEDAIIYCSEIYTDCREYDKAIKILSDYSGEKSDFAVKCISTLAKIYEKKGDLDRADEQYSRIEREYPASSAAEEASYRSGEIFYSAEKYSQAESRFTKYIYNYVDGKYADAAYYFSGDCNLKLGEIDRSIMQNTSLVTKYPESVYAYGAYKNLLQAYYHEENYREALSTARLLVRNYKEQSASDGIAQKVLELERIVGGTDRTIVEKTGEYERAGKTSTKKGRNAGSELVQLYVQQEELQQALELALELLEYQKDSDEMYYAAQNADFVAGYYYNAAQSAKAAEYYLKAAEYYRLSGQDGDNAAAAALYSAVDSFVAAGLKGDAQVTAKLLIELYPQTKQGQKVMNLLK